MALPAVERRLFQKGVGIEQRRRGARKEERTLSHSVEDAGNANPGADATAT